MILIRKSGPSNGAVALRNALRDAGSTAMFTGRDSFTRSPRLVINWGDMDDPTMHYDGRLINRRANRRVASNKISAFAALMAAGVRVPQHFTSRDAAVEWRGRLPGNFRPIILARSTATGSGGEGITVVRHGDTIPEALFYSEYIRKATEFRVHVINGRAVAVQQKRAVRGYEHTADQRLIRNHDNGWVFAVGDVEDLDGSVAALGVRATAALGLDLAAVDIIRSLSGDLFVLEANTKPGLESPTVLEAYVSALRSIEP